ncbi:hypothetical protein BDV36DRAFT_280765 [Aspergillus pseudocaelatus]|uniref:Uncharacterized protein n=1 Tax=Aspergillus pseudocaelatus TaxID=1825620 RepID=A0ABQ6WWJ7_9EURO|nr:hypothetical protein BDV36DRAFT_280765 [Aspergillus pseudocaelatus]
MSCPLDAKAEKIRREIKQMIPETATGDDNATEKADSLRSTDGRIMYAGGALGKKAIELRDHLGLGKELGWTIWGFTIARDMANETRSMYIVPLSSGSSLASGESLTEGHLVHNTDKLKLSPGATVIIYMK